MRVRLTNTWFDPDPLSVPLKSFTHVNLDGNDRVTVEDKTDADGAKLDHQPSVTPYLKCKRSGRVNILAPDEVTCSRCGEMKPRSDFYEKRQRGRRPTLSSWCKECCRTASKQRRGRDRLTAPMEVPHRESFS